jgi:hypothetical protein
MYTHFVKIRSQILVYLTHHLALPFLKLIRNPVKFPYGMSDLASLKKGTLGNDLYEFLNNKKLQLLPYYAKHDIKHLLLDYDTTDVGEVCLQCFMLGNGHISFPVFITVVFGVLFMPEHWKTFVAAYKRGSNSAPIKHWQWFTLINQQTNTLKKQLIK